LYWIKEGEHGRKKLLQSLRLQMQDGVMSWAESQRLRFPPFLFAALQVLMSAL